MLKNKNIHRSWWLMQRYKSILWILPDALEAMGRNGFLKTEGEVL